VVECTALEMRHTGNRIGGSNPSLSAITPLSDPETWVAPVADLWFMEVLDGDRAAPSGPWQRGSRDPLLGVNCPVAAINQTRQESDN
jgi:hypothetical protein